MSPELIKSLLELGGTVVVVALFLYYIQKKNGHMERIAQSFNQSVENHHEAMKEVAVKLESVKDTQIHIAGALDRSTRVIDKLNKKT